MYYKVAFLVFALLLDGSAAQLWQCGSSADCAPLAGAVCAQDGSCACAAGQQPIEGGTRCIEASPYYLSSCVQDFQCSRLSTGYNCGATEDGGGICMCQPGFHYFLGRCWHTRDFGEPCSLDHECLSVLRDPYSLACVQGVCACADGHYLRQRGECRRIGHEVGDGCVLDADCQFENGACDYWDLTCYDTSVSAQAASAHNVTLTTEVVTPETRQLHASCSLNSECGDFLVCSQQGLCICPVGYFGQGTSCFAELGSPVTSEASCPGVFTASGDICRCPANFYYEESMRECFKATTRFTDACTIDENCFTFGSAGVCGPPQEPWGLRTCGCRPELAVVDLAQQMCRLFSALGEVCEVESDCLAGEVQVLCLPDDEGVGRCSCPDHLEQEGGLCITRGLELGEECQVTAECSGAQHSECIEGVCTCGSAYVQIGEICQPAIGGECSEDTDCAIDNTSCQTTEAGQSCHCEETFVEFNQMCLAAASGYGAPCQERVQCTGSLGEGSECSEGLCDCQSSHHYRGDFCWPITGLFERCSRSSECYLGDMSERVVCRNDFCQCDFDYPYSDDQNTCLDSGGARLALPSLALLTITVLIVEFS